MKKYIIVICLFLVSISCDDALDQTNPNTLTPDNFWQTEADATSAIIGAYSPLSTIFFHGRIWSGHEIARSDEIFVQGDFYGASSVYATNPGDGNFTNAFAEIWKVIFRANLVLQNVPSIEMDETAKNNILGEAYFLRAAQYFILVNYWENIPLVTEPAGSLAETQQGPVDPGLVWDQIKADFAAAIPLLPESWDSDNKGRVFKASAAAFLGKTHLYLGEWNEAATQFKRIIDGEFGAIDLVPNFEDNFREGSENNIESLFEIQFDKTGAWTAGWGSDVPSTARYSSFSRDFAVGGASRMNTWVFDLFTKELDKDGAIDTRAYETLVWDYPGAKHFGQDFAVKFANDLADYSADSTLRMPLQAAKYLTPNISATAPVFNSDGNNKRILRFADVLLMYAEAVNEASSPTPAAYDAINRVRARANMPEIPAGLSQADFRQRVRDERVLELCNESQRPLDLRRWGLAPDRLIDNPELRPRLILYQDGRELYPIPQLELETNPAYNGQQNKGYE